MALFLVTTDQEKWERFLDYSDFSESQVKSSQFVFKLTQNNN